MSSRLHEKQTTLTICSFAQVKGIVSISFDRVATRFAVFFHPVKGNQSGTKRTGVQHCQNSVVVGNLWLERKEQMGYGTHI